MSLHRPGEAVDRLTGEMMYRVITQRFRDYFSYWEGLERRLPKEDEVGQMGLSGFSRSGYVVEFRLLDRGGARDGKWRCRIVRQTGYQRRFPDLLSSSGDSEAGAVQLNSTSRGVKSQGGRNYET
jgi:hypothetical protein